MCPHGENEEVVKWGWREAWREGERRGRESWGFEGRKRVTDGQQQTYMYIVTYVQYLRMYICTYYTCFKQGTVHKLCVY